MYRTKQDLILAFFLRNLYFGMLSLLHVIFIIVSVVDKGDGKYYEKTDERMSYCRIADDGMCLWCQAG